MFWQQLREVTSKRKYQLFGLACCCVFKHLLEDKSKIFLDNLELFIDGKISEEELETARGMGYEVYRELGRFFYDPYDCLSGDGGFITTHYNAARASLVKCQDYQSARSLLSAAMNTGVKIPCEPILKDIYNPNLLDLTFPQKAIELAEEIYNTNNQTTRLILSDFLEEFHFPEELYAHLKEPNHYKGCWVIDQILEKT